MLRRVVAGLACGLLGLLGRAEPAIAARFTFELAVPAHTERQVCQYVEIPLGRPGDAIAGFDVRLEGAESHHFHLFDATGIPPLTREMQDGSISACVAGEAPALVSADSRRVRVRLPRGVRLPWHAPQALVVNFHARNGLATEARARARVRLRLRRARPRDRIAWRWALSQLAIDIPPFSTATIRASATLAEALAFVTLSGHMHNRGLSLTAARDGRPWYVEEDWRHPSLRRFSPLLVVGAGTRIDLECVYDNGVTRPVRVCADGTPCPLVAGGSVEGAMCVLSGYVVRPP